MKQFALGRLTLLLLISTILVVGTDYVTMPFDISDGMIPARRAELLAYLMGIAAGWAIRSVVKEPTHHRREG